MHLGSCGDCTDYSRGVGAMQKMIVPFPEIVIIIKCTVCKGNVN